MVKNVDIAVDAILDRKPYKVEKRTRIPQDSGLHHEVWTDGSSPCRLESQVALIFSSPSIPRLGEEAVMDGTPALACPFLKPKYFSIFRVHSCCPYLLFMCFKVEVFGARRSRVCGVEAFALLSELGDLGIQMRHGRVC